MDGVIQIGNPNVPKREIYPHTPEELSKNNHLNSIDLLKLFETYIELIPCNVHGLRPLRTDRDTQ